MKPIRVFPLLVLALSFFVTLPAQAQTYQWARFVGKGGTSAVGLGSQASFSTCVGVATADAAGNLYVTDLSGHVISKVSPTGVVTALAGAPGVSDYVDDTGTAARFKGPERVAVDGAGNAYVVDQSNKAIRKITPAGVVSTVISNRSELSSLSGIAVDAAGANIYYTSNFAVYHINSGLNVSILAGDASHSGYQDDTGPGAGFWLPSGLALDEAAGALYVVEAFNGMVRKVTTAGGVVTTLAGGPVTQVGSGFVDGVGGDARFNEPKGVAVDPATHIVYVADTSNHAIRKITPDGTVTTIGGTSGRGSQVDGYGTDAGFSSPISIALAPGGIIYVADSGANRIIRGVDTATASGFNSPANDQPLINQIPVAFTPSTAALASSLKLIFDNGGGIVRVLSLSDTLGTASQHFFAINASAPVDGTNVTAISPAGTFIPNGTYNLTLQYANAGGNPVTTLPALRTILDSVPPFFAQTQLSYTLEATSANGAPLTFDENVTDGLSGVDPDTVAISAHSGDTFPISATPTSVTFYARDYAGNISQQTMTVLVHDTTPPAATAFVSGFVLADGTGHATVGDLSNLLAGTVDPNDSSLFDRVTAKADLTIVQDPLPTAEFLIGTYPLKFTITDQAGNHSEVDSSFTVAFPGSNLPELSASHVAGPIVAHVPKGDAIPGGAALGLDPAATIGAFFTPAVSDFHDLAARIAILNGKKTLSALYQEDGAGTGKIAALQGVQATDFGALVTYKSFLDPLLSADGSIAFGGKVAGGGLKPTEDEALWSDVLGGGPHASAPLARVLWEGHELGLGTGILLKSLTSASIRDGELVALVALTGPNVTTKTNQALIRITSTGTQPLLRTGDTVGVNGVKVVSISAFQPGVASTGQGRTHGALSSAVRVKTDKAGDVLLLIDNATGSNAVLLSTVGQDATLGSLTAKIYLPDSGANVVSRINAKFPNAVPPVTKAVDALVVGSAGFTDALKVGTPLSNLTDSPKFSAFGDPVTNAQDKIAFRGTFTGKTVKAPANTALYEMDDALQFTEVVRGGAAATQADGVTLLPGATFKTFLNYALPDGPVGGLVFTAELTGKDAATNKPFTATTKLGLWGKCSTNLIRLLLQGGQDVTVAPGVTKKLATFKLLDSLPGSFGSRRSYNAAGSVAVLATFTDKSQSLLRIDIP